VVILPPAPATAFNDILKALDLFGATMDGVSDILDYLRIIRYPPLPGGEGDILKFLFWSWKKFEARLGLGCWAGKQASLLINPE